MSTLKFLHGFKFIACKAIVSFSVKEINLQANFSATIWLAKISD